MAKQLEYKSEIISAELKKIIQHSLYAKFSTLLATINYLLPSNGILAEQAQVLNLLVHPIVVILQKKSQDCYFCVSGIRSLLLAKSSLPLDKTLPVTLVKCQRHDEIEMMVHADILLSPLLMSVRSPATIGAIYQTLKKEQIDRLLNKDINNKSALAEQMGFAKNTVFSPKTNENSEFCDRPGKVS